MTSQCHTVTDGVTTTVTYPVTNSVSHGVRTPSVTPTRPIRENPPCDRGLLVQVWGSLSMTVDQKAQVANAREEQQMSNENDEQNSAEVACPRCEGCGQLADSEDREPWSVWTALPVGSALAVTMGLVKPEPCDECGGSGKVAAQPAVLHTPIEWCRIEGVEILDPDGWRGINGRPWTEPITLAEFQERLAVCTQRKLKEGEEPWKQIPIPPATATCKCPGFLCSCHHGDTQPATEHHVGTLDLSGEGNPEPDGQHMPIGIRSTDVGPFIRCSCGTSPSPHHWIATHWPGDKTEGMRLADEVLAAAREASPISDDMAQAAIRAYEAFGAGMQDALEAAYPAIRQQVAEEIAVALEAVPAEVYPEEFFPVDGISVDCQSARVMRFAYPAAARMARDIGEGA